MAEKAENTKATVEERLAKATECYKELKSKYDQQEQRLAEALKEIEKKNEAIKELQDEITINGNSTEEIKTLNGRLDVAKKTFAEQKGKIKSLEEMCSNFEAKNKAYKTAVSSMKEIIAGLD